MLVLLVAPAREGRLDLDDVHVGVQLGTLLDGQAFEHLAVSALVEGRLVHRDVLVQFFERTIFRYVAPLGRLVAKVPSEKKLDEEKRS